MGHRKPDFHCVINLKRTEFHSNPVLKITLETLSIYKEKNYSYFIVIIIFCNSPFHSSCSKILDVKNILENYLAWHNLYFNHHAFSIKMDSWYSQRYHSLRVWSSTYWVWRTRETPVKREMLGHSFNELNHTVKLGT